jgi:hypothetical protein
MLEEGRLEALKMPLAVFLTVYISVIVIAALLSLETGCLQSLDTNCPQTPAAKILELGLPLGLGIGWVPATVATAAYSVVKRLQ